MNIQIREITNDSSQAIWNNLADQLLAAQQVSQQPLTNALVERVFPEQPSNTRGGILITAVERLRAAHRQIMQALDGIPSVKSDLLQEAIA